MLKWIQKSMNQPVDIIKLLSIVSSCPKGYMLFFASLGRMEFVCTYVQESWSHNIFIHHFSFLSEMKVKCFIQLAVLWEFRRGVGYEVFLSSPFSEKRKGSHCHYFNKPLNYISAVWKTVNIIIIIILTCFVLSEHLFVSSSACLYVWSVFIL